MAELVVETLRSGWLTTGPKTKEFEKQITTYCGNKSTLCVNAATNGLKLILRWFGVGEGDEVIIPAYTYCATANVVVHCGAKPVFVDVGADFNISVENIRKAITPETKAVIPVDFAGFPCDYDEINDLVASDRVKAQFNPAGTAQEMLGRILVLSDAAHSFGAIYKQRRTGCLADVSVFSFHAVKNLTTGEGGAICLNLQPPFNNLEIYKSLNIKSLHGQTKDALSKTKLGEWKYDVVEAGFKCNMTDIQAALGLAELEKYETENLPKRRHIFDNYNRALGGYSWAELPVYKTDIKTSSFHIFPLRIKGISEAQRDDIISEIFARGVSVNVHFIPVPMLSHYKSMGYNIDDFSTAYDNYSREITLPVYYDLEDNDLEKVVSAVTGAVEFVFKK